MNEHPVGDLSSRSRFRDQRSKSSKVAAATIQLIFQLKSSSFGLRCRTLVSAGDHLGVTKTRRVVGRGRGRYRGRRKDLSNP